MTDDADRAQPNIENVIEDGRKRAERDFINSRLLPIIQEMDGVRFGVCHYCESEIAPGHLFCPADTEEPQYSCSIMDEQKRKRDRANGL